jgi:AcrR family transcriptional regulator
MMEKKINKHEIRTRATRELLLQAAETIFVRDGYEGAELGEIAALAGRTKGAIYAQFKSKEDVFLALVAQRVASFRSQIDEIISRSASREERWFAFRAFCLQFATDQTWALLMMEYKLYVIRHPEAKERHQLFKNEMKTDDRERRIAAIFGPEEPGADGLARPVAIEAVHHLLGALAVEMRFASAPLPDDVLKTISNRIFDALLPA